MAERHPREAALRRVHGPGALFAAAYGNVGSSIYYALGLVALYALGLTPVTFMIAGLIFAFTAATYVEATVLYPRPAARRASPATPSTSSPRFLAGWAQMLTYIVTVGDLGLLRPALPGGVLGAARPRPGRRHLRHRPARLPGAAQRQGHRGVGAAQPGARDRRPRDPGRAGGDRAARSSSTPTCSSTRSTSGPSPSWGDFLLGIAVGMVAYTGIETISNMSEEARDAEPHDPARDRAGGARGGRPLRVPAGDRALGDAGHRRTPGGEFTTELGTTFADDPVLGIVENIGLSRGLTDVLRGLRRDPRRGDPADRHQRGADRALAADLLDGPAPPAAGDRCARSTRGSRRRTSRSSSSRRSRRW